MERDIQLIRAILERVANEADGQGLAIDAMPSYTAEQVAYHVQLCYQAGYLDANKSHYAGETFPVYHIRTLTWKGQNALAGYRR